MSFEDKLREQFRRADTSIPGERIDWSRTMAKARRARMRFTTLATVGALSVIGIAAFVVVNMNDELDPAPVTPTASDASQTPALRPEETPSALETPPNDHLCLASEMASEPYGERAAGLPEIVAGTRAQIVALAIECQYEFLEQLAYSAGPNLDHSEDFQYSYGVEEGPAKFWRDRERQARREDEPTSSYMRGLVGVLQLPYCKESQDDGSGTDTERVYYIWPRVHCAGHRTAEDWNDLKGLYTKEQIDQMREGDLYFGFRVGILENGDWVYFIAGD